MSVMMKYGGAGTNERSAAKYRGGLWANNQTSVLHRVMSKIKGVAGRASM